MVSRGFYHSSRPQSENKRKQKNKLVLRPCQRTKKTVKHEGGMILIVAGAVGIGKKLEELEIRGGIETIQTSVLLRLTRIHRRVKETQGDLLSLTF